MARKYEKPQAGNPHGLTINQHVIPKSLISRFCNEGGQVALYSKRLKKTLKLDPAADIFVAKRSWDQKGEWIGKQIEDAFLNLVNLIIEKPSFVLREEDKATIEEFYGLWRCRHDLRLRPLKDMTINGIVGDELDIDTMERLERGHVMYIGPNGTLPGRLMAGVQIIRNIDFFVSTVRNVRWGILRAGAGEFVFPDTFREWLIIPISPNIAIAADCDDTWLSLDGVALINAHAIDSCHEYYFSKNFDSCPIEVVANR